MPNSKYVVFTNSYLSSSDMDIIKILYLPIIGLEAMSIYMLVRDELNVDKLLSKPKNHTGILDVTKGTIGSFVEERSKLEAIGLLRTYEDEVASQHTLYYEVNPPMKPSEFFMNPATNKLIHKTLGHEKYNRLKNRFKVDKVDVSKLVNVTKRFNQVFSCNVNEKHHEYLNENDKFADKVTADIKHDNQDFSLDKFNEKLRRKRVPTKLITKELMNFILSTASTYNVSEANMARYVSMGLRGNEIDRDFILKSCEVWSKDSTSNEKQSFNIADIEERELMMYAKRLNPVDFLKYLYNGMKPNNRDVRLLNETSRDYRLNDEVINILTYVSLVENDHRLSKDYYFFVASQWSRKNIVNATQALKQYKQVGAKKTKAKAYSNNKSKSKVEIPDWYNENIEKKEPEKNQEERIKKLLNKWG